MKVANCNLITPKVCKDWTAGEVAAKLTGGGVAYTATLWLSYVDHGAKVAPRFDSGPVNNIKANE